MKEREKIKKIIEMVKDNKKDKDIALELDLTPAIVTGVRLLYGLKRQGRDIKDWRKVYIKNNKALTANLPMGMVDKKAKRFRIVDFDGKKKVITLEWE